MAKKAAPTKVKPAKVPSPSLVREAVVGENGIPVRDAVVGENGSPVRDGVVATDIGGIMSTPKADSD